MNSHLLISLLLASFALQDISGTALTKDNFRTQTQGIFYLNFYPALMQKIRYLYDSGLDDFQTNCSREFLQFWEDLDSNSQAAYLDSFGKVGAGILTGNVVYLGYYDQCIEIGNTDYCNFPFDVTLTTTTVSSNASVTIPVEIGMCFPSSCDAKDFYDLFFIDSDVAFYSKSFIDINAITYAVDVTASIKYTALLCPWRDLKWSNSSIVVLTVCILLIVLVLTGTMVDVSLWLLGDIFPKLLPKTEPQKTMKYSTTCEVKHSINEDEPHAKHKPKTVTEKRYIEFIKDLMLSFSLYKTVPPIMATHQPATAIASINGIRVISMLWVILGHTFVWGTQYRYGFSNIQEISETVNKHFLFQLVDNFTSLWIAFLC